jgi:undecaprenyl diphosphate synthase
MIVRTGGEMRLSNFLMWQSVYAELFFTDTLWPDLTNAEVDAMVEQFNNRKRRFGGV